MYAHSQHRGAQCNQSYRLDTVQAAPETVILAQDEASLYLQATLQVVWHTRGQTQVVKVDPGREMVHVYGALNLQHGQEIAMPSPVMNAEVTALYLQKLLPALADQYLSYLNRTRFPSSLLEKYGYNAIRPMFI